jgi:hypothetical protein
MYTEIVLCGLETEIYVLLRGILGSKVYRYTAVIVRLEGSGLSTQLIMVLPFTC